MNLKWPYVIIQSQPPKKNKSLKIKGSASVEEGQRDNVALKSKLLQITLFWYSDVLLVTDSYFDYHIKT